MTKSYTLCGSPGCRCAKIKKNQDGTWTITDDSGGSVILTLEELTILQEMPL